MYRGRSRGVVLLLRRRVVGSDARRGQIQHHSGGVGLDSEVMPRGVRSVGPTAVLRRTTGCVRRQTEQVLWVRPQRDYQERGICRKVAARSWALALSRGPSQAWGNRKNPHPQPRVRNWGGHRAREAPRMCCQTSQKNRGSRTPPDSSAHDLGAGVPVGLSRAPWIEFSIGLRGLEPSWM